jgi:hypothetical protein
MPVPNSGNWKAVEEPNLEGGGYRVRVTGEVEAESPSLHARTPQGLDPRILMLDLSKVDEGSDYQEVEFRQPSEVHAYDHVDIFFLGQEVSRIEVEQPDMMTGPGRRKKQAKPARKQAAKRKSAKKKTTKTAKKKAKKTAKKAAKRKSKKKSGKRSSRKKRI